jgi:ATP-dependent Zn protease
MIREMSIVNWTEEKLKRHIGCSLFFIVISVVVVLANIGQTTAPQQVPYSQFIEALDEGTVTQAVIGTDRIVWQEGQGEEHIRYRADRISDMDDFTIMLRLHSLGAEVIDESSLSLWTTVQPWLLPAAILGAILSWSIFQMQRWYQNAQRELESNQHPEWEEGGATISRLPGMDKRS